MEAQGDSGIGGGLAPILLGAFPLPITVFPYFFWRGLGGSLESGAVSQIHLRERSRVAQGEGYTMRDGSMMTRDSARLVLLAAATVCFWSASSTPAAAADYATGTNAAAVAVGDFNGDGKDDLAVANQGSNTVSVLLSNLDGTFRPASPSSYAVGAFPWSVAVGDFNGDGILDLAVGNGGSNTVSVLLGNGNGSFRPAP